MDSKTYTAVCRYLQTGNYTNFPWSELQFYYNVCYIDANGKLRDRKTMLPIACKEELNMIMVQAHISAQKYHRSIDETISMITSHYIPNVRNEVTLFIENCAFCTRMSQKKAELNKELIEFTRQLQQEMIASGTMDNIKKNLATFKSVESLTVNQSEFVMDLNLNEKLQTPTKSMDEVISPNRERLDDAESAQLAQLNVELNMKEAENVKLKEEVQGLKKENAEMFEQVKKFAAKDNVAVKEEENMRRLRDDLEHSRASIDQLLQDVDEKDALIAVLQNDLTLLQSEIAKVHSLWVS